MKDKIVVDADVPVVLENFNEADTDEVLEKYESMGRWADVSVDRDGDIILWEM